MFSRISDTLRRHKRKFIVGGVLAGGIYCAHRYLRYRLQQWEEDQSKTLLEKMKRQQHFASILSTSDTTILSSAGKLREKMLEEFSIDDLLEKVKSKPANRLEVWEEIKLRVVSFGIASVYAESLLICALRIQLGVIGGAVYLNSEKNKGDTTAQLKTQQVHKKFLEMIQYFLDVGVLDLMKTVKNAVVAAFGHIDLKQSVTADDFLLGYNFVRTNLTVVSDSSGYLINDQWRLLCSTCSACADGEQCNHAEQKLLNSMVSETEDLLQCSDGVALLETLINNGFRDLNELVRRSFAFLGKQSVPMVKVLPTLKTQMFTAREDKFVTDSLSLDCTKNFLANVYEAFCKNVEY